MGEKDNFVSVTATKNDRFVKRKKSKHPNKRNMKAWRTPERILPVEEIPVLAIANRMMPFVAVYFDGEWHCYHTNQRLNVLYWMPIPLTPEE